LPENDLGLLSVLRENARLSSLYVVGSIELEDLDVNMSIP
jgi:hypothetical protein